MCIRLACWQELKQELLPMLGIVGFHCRLGFAYQADLGNLGLNRLRGDFTQDYLLMRNVNNL